MKYITLWLPRDSGISLSDLPKSARFQVVMYCGLADHNEIKLQLMDGTDFADFAEFEQYIVRKEEK